MPMTLSADNFEFICRLVNQQVGMALTPDQQLFVEGRLDPVARRLGWDHLQSLVSRLRDHQDHLLVTEVIEALVTHETSFFRDPHYFDELTERILPRLFARRAPERRLTIWCAACATGQEAYSVAMILRERFAQELQEWNLNLLATDLSFTALQKARIGHYSDMEVSRGLTDARLAQHFRRQQTGWQIDHGLMQIVRFRQVNLTSVWPYLPPVDLVLMRNVLIYMSQTARQSILNRMQKTLHPDGCLMLGSSESANALNLPVVRVQS